jgi:hypothetical protein
MHPGDREAGIVRVKEWLFTGFIVLAVWPPIALVLVIGHVYVPPVWTHATQLHQCAVEPDRDVCARNAELRAVGEFHEAQRNWRNYRHYIPFFVIVSALAVWGVISLTIISLRWIRKGLG